MNEVIQTLQSWWNNNVAFANTAGVTSTFIVFAYAYIGTKLKKKNNDITIDAKQSSDMVNQLTGKINELVTNNTDLNNKLKLLTDLVMAFANSTKITSEDKKALIDIYANIKADYKPIIKDTIENIKNTVADVIETVTEGTDYYEKFKKSIED